MTATFTPSQRDTRLDRIRGLAIVLMVIDHASVWALTGPVAAGAGAQVLLWVREYPTRLSMPLFMLVSGLLLERHVPSPRRRLEVAGVAVAINIALWACAPGISVPEILLVWSFAMVLAEPIRTMPVPVAAAGILWAFTWPVTWSGYQPGVIIALLALGVLAGRTAAGIETLGSHLPRQLDPIGRRPLTIYAGHLAIICVAAVAYRGGFR